MGLRCSGHREDPATVLRRDRIVVDRVAGPAGPELGRIDVRAPAVCAVAALDDKTGHEAVKDDAVVVATSGERDEVADCSRTKVSLESDDDRALRRLDRRRRGRAGRCAVSYTHL